MRWRAVKRGFGRAWRALTANPALDPWPLRRAFRGYSRGRLAGDLRAGLNVALLAFPQGMAYAFIAGLPIHYGLYASAVAAIIGPLFAGSHYITLGPTNATAVMLLSGLATIGVGPAERLGLLPPLLLLVGLLLVVGAWLRVANLIQYISRTVITGYITAAALLIILNQLRAVFGFSFTEAATTFWAAAGQTVAHLGDTRWQAVAMSAMTAGLFLGLRRYCPALPNVAVTLVVMSAAGAALRAWAGFDFKTLAAVSLADWKLTVPVPTPATLNLVAQPALAIALLSVLEGISIGKSLAARSGERIDANQEMFGIGMANLGCAFFSGMSASGSLTRSVLNWASGASSPLASIFSGLIVAAGALALGPLTRFIPQASLAVVVIAIGVSLINRRAIKVVLRATRSDAVVFVVTLVAGLLLPLDVAIYYGAATSILLFLRKAATPEMVEYTFTPEGELAQLGAAERRADPEISIVHVEGNLFFGAADLFRDQIRRVFEDPNLKIVVLKMRNAHLLDASGVMALEELVRFMRERGRHLLVSEARKESIRVFKRSGILEVLGRDNIFPDTPHNHTLSTAKALRRAKELVGGGSARVRIYGRDNTPA